MTRTARKTYKNIALISDADSPGPFRHQIDDWQINGVEALAWALTHKDRTVTVWHGTEPDEAFLNTICGHCDAVLINLKHSLWDAAPIIAHRARAAGIAVWGYQEGPSNLLGLLAPGPLERFREAMRACDRIFLYDRRALDLWRAALPGIPVSWLPLPAPVEVYEKYRIPLKDRPGGTGSREPARVALCQPISAKRGAALSITLAAQMGTRRKPVSILCQGHSPCDVGLAARLITETNLGATIPDAFGHLPWTRRRSLSAPRNETTTPRRRPRRRIWLHELARCRLAINLDTATCYGRFQADCAGLGVPCIGSKAPFMQDELWHELAFTGWREFSHGVTLGRSLLTNPAEAALYVARADRRRHQFTPSRIRALFEEGA